MAVYRFRVTFEDHDEVSRDIEIRSVQTLDDFHHAIHSFIGFDASKPASFYLSDDNWKKGKEFTTRELNGDDKERAMTMRSTRLADIIADPHQKIYYIFDPVAQWAFRIELIKIMVNEEAGAAYPRCVKSLGEAPKQYGIPVGAIPPPEDVEELPEEILMEEESETETGIEEDEIPVSLDKNAEEEPAEADDEMIDQEEDDEL